MNVEISINCISRQPLGEEVKEALIKATKELLTEDRINNFVEGVSSGMSITTPGLYAKIKFKHLHMTKEEAI